MADDQKPPLIISVRLNDDAAPDRSERFHRALSRGGATSTNVIKALVDAFSRYVEEQQSMPLTPYKLESGTYDAAGESTARMSDRPSRTRKKK